MVIPKEHSETPCFIVKFLLSPHGSHDQIRTFRHSENLEFAQNSEQTMDLFRMCSEFVIILAKILSMQKVYKRLGFGCW